MTTNTDILLKHIREILRCKKIDLLPRVKLLIAKHAALTKMVEGQTKMVEGQNELTRAKIEYKERNRDTVHP